MSLIKDLYSFFWGPIVVRWFWIGYLTAGLGVLASVYIVHKLHSKKKETLPKDEILHNTKIGAFEKDAILFLIYSYLLNYKNNSQKSVSTVVETEQTQKLQQKQ